MSNSNAMNRKSFWKQYKFDEDLDKDGCEDHDWACEMIARCPHARLEKDKGKN